ncbi:MAG: BamA/TamA family outer membrane protein [Deltaproteobacteria bacterium]|nr:BamA/TamA family outer membrane protein [Deltaproteobacteria bacterium]
MSLWLIFSLASPLVAQEPSAEEVVPVVEPVADDVAAADAPWTWSFGGLPALGYDTDNGFLFGAVGSVYLHDGKTKPYRVAISGGVTVTTKLVQDHYVNVDALNVGDLPLRLLTRAGWTQSLTQNYCGTGMTVTCDPEVARRDADRLQLKGTPKEDFLRRYYLFRFMNPWASVSARYALVPLPTRVEIFGGWRGSGYIPGTWADDDGDGEADLSPYPGSQYAQDFAVGEPGFASVLQAGVMYDTRDNEPSPRKGVWAEASLRAATALWGSSWDWVGGNTTIRGYLPIIDGEAPARLTLATRFVADAIVGDPPIQEMVRPGGFVDYLSFGGSEMGRGIRAQRYVGKLKLYVQNELRWRFVEWEMFGQPWAASTNAFVDAAMIGTELSDPRAFAGTPPVGGGGGLLLHWNENFILRLDVATSAVENYPVSVYITLGQTF